MDFDQILRKCGDFNRYQFMILAVFAFINVITAMHYFTQTIISFVPDHWCYHEKLESFSFGDIAQIYANTSNTACTRLEDNFTVSADKCNRWIYNYDYGFRSMNTEFDWVCHNAYKARIGQSFFFLGSVMGTLGLGLLSDRFGRLPMLILSNLCGCIGDFATMFSQNVPTFSLCRFVSGLAVDTNYYALYIILIEYLRPSMRSRVINATVGIFYCLGLILTPWLAVYAGNWRRFLSYTSLPMLLVPVSYFLIQESAQWLVTKHDVDGAIKRLKRIAKFNGRIVLESDFEEFRRHCTTQTKMQQNNAETKKRTLLDMFKTPRMRRMTLILFFKSMVISLCYDAVTRNVEGMGISPFTMFTLNAFTLIPSSLLIMLQDYIGRKAMTAGSMFFAGCVTVIAGTIIAYSDHQQNNILLVCLTMAARFGVAISLGSSSQYTMELIPTSVRGQGSAAVHVAGYAAAFPTPYLLLLGTYFKAAPPLILGMFFFTGSFVCLLLPETLHRTLPKTLQEGEIFGIGEGIFDFPCIKRHAADIDKDFELDLIKKHEK